MDSINNRIRTLNIDIKRLALAGEFSITTYFKLLEVDNKTFEIEIDDVGFLVRVDHSDSTANFDNPLLYFWSDSTIDNQVLYMQVMRRVKERISKNKQ